MTIPFSVLRGINSSAAGIDSLKKTATTSVGISDYVSTFLKQLENVWSGVSTFYKGNATLSTPWSDPNLLGSYSCWKVGQCTLFAGYEGVRQGRCHFAGEHCSGLFQGFMEGGAQEGIRAGNEILADCRAGQTV